MNVKNENIIAKIRRLMPHRPVSLGEAKLLAERQAGQLLKLLKIRQVPVDVFRVTGLPGVQLHLLPRYQMPDLGGICASKRDRHTVVINSSNPPGRCRMDLAHEFKHLLDAPLEDALYSQLGLGDDEIQHRLKERICRHFAACFLMPKKIIKRAWSSGIQDPEALADLFDVSTSAMILRLRYLGFSNEPPKPASYYFTSQRPPAPKGAWLDPEPQPTARGAECLPVAGRAV